MKQRKFKVLKTVYHAEQQRDVPPGEIIDLDYLIKWDAEKPVRNRLFRLIKQGFVEEVTQEEEADSQDKGPKASAKSTQTGKGDQKTGEK